jgi:GT2 family glycosyltransferase
MTGNRSSDPVGSKPVDADGPETVRLAAVVEGPPPPGRWDEVVEVGQRLTAAAVAACTATHLVLCPPTVALLPEAGDLIREALGRHAELDLLYADSYGPDQQAPAVAGLGRVADHRPEEGDISHLRPGYSPDRLRAQMYLGDVLVVRRTVLVSHLAAGDDLDLAPSLGQVNLLVGRCRSIAHLPRLLYRTAGPRRSMDPRPTHTANGATGGSAEETATPTGSEHDDRLSAEGFWALADPREDHRVIDLRPRLLERPPVSVIMATCGADREVAGRRVVLCLQAIDALIAKTTYQPWELVVVLTPGTPADLPDRIGSVLAGHSSMRRPDVRVVRDDRPFNYAEVNNRGSLIAGGRVLVFLNDDTVVRTTDWMDRMVMHATRPDVGAVGARLLYGDGSIQHAGIWSRGGHPAHRYEGFPADHPGHLDGLTVPQNCLAVSGACLAVEADKFRRVGGFCGDFPSSYNDVDLCLKLDAQGYRTVVDPGAVLTHFEASSRDPSIAYGELELLHRRWRRMLTADPYDNPHHLAPGSDEFPSPDPLVTLAAQRAGVEEPAHGRFPRIWVRPSKASPSGGGAGSSIPAGLDDEPDLVRSDR